MVEKTDRRENANGPRSADGRRFEVFVREAESDPLRHVGTVAAPTPEAAHEEASKLFAWYARDVWVCPAAEVSRFSAEALADDAEGGASAEDADDDEPRVYEETEGTPTVSCGGAPPADAVDADDAGGQR
ncbi:Htur_1727 family rSAM-partnered candidate RiPP [Halorubrum sp. RMP-47]|uniref:Htur_1727 family rSAM-partnered candidate RiPP n=1 Tax=Halorubrum miltondacostae TaxID=3076378 RepID=A0ABD5M098_9EURY